MMMMIIHIENEIESKKKKFTSGSYFLLFYCKWKQGGGLMLLSMCPYKVIDRVGR